MKEQLVSLDVAVMAKEKDFNIPTPWYYHPRYGLHTAFWREDDNDTHEDYNSDKWAIGYYSAPTQSLLQKWIRYEHNIIVTPMPYRNKDAKIYDLMYYFSLVDDNYKDEVCCNAEDLNCSYSNFNTYEEALEEGLKEALKLIK